MWGKSIILTNLEEIEQFLSERVNPRRTYAYNHAFSYLQRCVDHTKRLSAGTVQHTAPKQSTVKLSGIKRIRK